LAFTVTWTVLSRRVADARAAASDNAAYCGRVSVFYQDSKERKSIYMALFWPRWYIQSAQAWITQFYLQTTPCLPFLRERLPDVTTTAAEAADIQLQLTTHLSTPRK